MTCYIIDDEQYAINVLVNYTKQIPFLSLEGTSTNPLIGLDFIQKNNVDLLFLDIQMDMLNGIEMIKMLPQKTKVIFCTAYSEFAISGFELEAIDYLMKPIEFKRFEKAAHRAQNMIHNIQQNLGDLSNDYIYVKTEQKGNLLKLYFNEILFIESKRNYVQFVLNDKKVLVYGSMQNLESQLPDKQFIRVHKSYMVSINKIISIKSNIINFTNKEYSVPIGIMYRESLLTRFSDKILKC